MAEVLAITGRRVEAIAAGWELALFESGRWSGPDDAEAAEWLPARVPGTVAAALAALGRWSADAPTPLHDRDVCYRVRLCGFGPRTLRFEGLATFAEIYLDGRRIASSSAMFEPLAIPLVLDGEHRLYVIFRGLTAALDGLSGKRARWRTRMIADPRLRFVRTTLLGHMPGWCPAIDAVGPFRPVLLVEEGAVRARRADLRATLEDGEGVLAASLDLDGVPEGARPVLVCGGRTVALDPGRAEGNWRGVLHLPGIAPWWPATHGDPALHAVAVEVGSARIDLGRTGFRTLTVDRGTDGRDFALMVNGTRVFCRGACWTPPDLVGLDGREATYRRELTRMREAGLNIVRVGGTMLYEAPAFHRVCDELGLLVWQDMMFANLDYPADEAFSETVRQEVAALLDPIQASPSLAVLCGGSEVAQQAAMMGLAEAARAHPLFERVIPEAAAAIREVAYVPGSPWGGLLPFVPEAGPSHYYGVGAYRRPLDDARRACVRFASECLAFAHLPAEATLRRHRLDPDADPARWKAAVPRDGGADWDFEDVREHYLAALWGVDGSALRASDPARWRALARAVTAHLVEAVFDDWRRPGSTTAGGIVWFWRDLVAGAGWGYLDADGWPKSAFYALRRASAPLRLSITDEGTNGLALHLVNDGPRAVSGELRLRCLRDGRLPVVSATQPVEVAARSGLTLSAFALLGAFFDAGDAYRFGPAPHDLVHAEFASADGTPLAEAFHHLAPATARFEAALRVVLRRDDDGYALDLETDRALRAVTIDDDRFVPDDDGFDLAPGRARTVRLASFDAASSAAPAGRVSALNWLGEVAYAG